MRRRLLAWLNLGYRFGTHLMALPLRRFGEPGIERFTRAVAPEGYVPLSPDDRRRYPEFMGCINCGLCSLACPALRDAAASGWAEPWTFVVGPSRSIDRASLAAAGPDLCTRCSACEAVCPTGVPIPLLAAVVDRLAARAVNT